MAELHAACKTNQSQNQAVRRFLKYDNVLFDNHVRLTERIPIIKIYPTRFDFVILPCDSIILRMRHISGSWS